jgi:hypothetical protein
MSGSSEFGKCSFFPIENSRFLVDGKYSNYDYKYASNARKYEHLCGKEGKYYVKKNTNKKDNDDNDHIDDDDNDK